MCGGQQISVARCGTSCRSRRRLKGLPGSQTGRTVPPFAGRKRKSRIRTHEEGAGTEVSSDTYPLRTKANRACGEAPRASVPAGATEVRLAAGFDAVPTSGARGAEGTACPCAVTTARGSTSCTTGTSDRSWETGRSARLPGVTSTTSAKGSSTPSAYPRSSDRDLDVPAPDIEAPAHLEAGSTTPGLASDPG